MAIMPLVKSNVGIPAFPPPPPNPPPPIPPMSLKEEALSPPYTAGLFISVSKSTLSSSPPPPAIPSAPPSPPPITLRFLSFVSFIPSLRSSKTALKPLVVLTKSSFNCPTRLLASIPAWEFFPRRRFERSSVTLASSNLECKPSILDLMRSTSTSARSLADSSANMRVPPAPVLTRRDSSASNEDVVETSLEISDAAWRNVRSSARAGLFCCCCCCCEEGAGRPPASPPDGWVLVEVEPPARMELMAPVAGMERASEKNSSVRSAIVLLLLIFVFSFSFSFIISIA
mmetsp:Transcript_26982/g.64795  ORF Transcript_26982/g.64795 Transcript_26982/m.64795 type:complete len:286 (+) Transcript_26982:646-1503(+)